jgi:hypothetical protein
MRKAGILFSIVCCVCLALISVKGYSQESDLIGYRGGYKALSRLCEQNLDNASKLLAGEYSRGYFVSLTILPGSDSINEVKFLTATPTEMARQITWALKGTNGGWVKRNQQRKLLVPIFFCQNTPPNDSLFSQLLITNNVGFTMDQYPDEWPTAVEGVWIHPICPMITGGGARQPLAPGASAPAASAPVATAPTPAAPVAASGATVAAAATATTVPATVAGTAAATATTAPATVAGTSVGTTAAGTASTAATPQAPPGYVLTKIEGPAGPDTVSANGIFKTKDLYDQNAVLFGGTAPIEQKGLLSWYPVGYAAYGPVRVKQANKDNQEFSPGSIYGFKSDNINFVYLKGLKQYLSVVYSSPSFILMMDERKENGYNGATNIDGVFYYAKNTDGVVKEFSRKNIDADFATTAQEASDMQLLRKQLDKHSITMTRGDFEACKQLSKDYLTKWAPSK